METGEERPQEAAWAVWNGTAAAVAHTLTWNRLCAEGRAPLLQWLDVRQLRQEDRC